MVSLRNARCVAQRQFVPVIGSTAQPEGSPGCGLRQLSTAGPWGAAINRHLLLKTPRLLRSNHLESDATV